MLAHIPADPTDAPEVRFLNHCFDLHVMSPIQHAVAGALTGIWRELHEGLTVAVEKLERAYARLKE